MQVTNIDLIGNHWFTDVTKVNKPIKVLDIFFTYRKHKNWELNFDLTFTNAFNHPIKISLSI